MATPRLRKPAVKLKVPARIAPWDPKNANPNAVYSRGPANAPGVTPQGFGVDPTYEAMLGSANRNLATTVAGLDYQRGQLGQVYGLGRDAAGNVFDDPSNPYSRAAALAQSFKRAQAGTTNSMAAQGQLYSGATQNAQNENTNRNNMARDAMIRQFLSDNQQIDQARLGAANAYQDALGQAGAGRIERALSNRPDPASLPSGPAIPSKPKAGFQFVMKTGPRAGQSYKLVPGKGSNAGQLVREYEDGHREAR